jgi:uncharacterized membrane protein YkvA (DUF1232 family)
MVVLCVACSAVLLVTGRKVPAVAVARFVPDCLVLFRRLLSDPRVPRRKKVLLALVVAYLASPIDFIPDFIPVAGYLDDVAVVVLSLRYVVRGSGTVVQEHWPGPPESLQSMLRVAARG